MRFLLAILSLLALGGVLSGVLYTALAETPIPAADPALSIVQMVIDGLPVLPDTPVVDSRPICTLTDEPMPIKIILVWSDGSWVSCDVTQPLFRMLDLNLGVYGGAFSFTFDPPAVFADVNRNGVVNATDMGMVKAFIGKSVEDEAARVCDLNRDGVVSATDLALCKAAIGDGI